MNNVQVQLPACRALFGLVISRSGHYRIHMDNNAERFASAVAAELRAQRARTGVTYDGLVEATGLSKSSVFKYMNGKREIPMSSFFALCRALDITPQAIFTAAEQASQE